METFQLNVEMYALILPITAVSPVRETRHALMIADSMKTIVCLNVHVIQNALLVVHAQGGAEEFLQRINVKLSGVTKPKLVMMIAELNEPNALKDAIVIVHARINVIPIIWKNVPTTAHVTLSAKTVAHVHQITN